MSKKYIAIIAIACFMYFWSWVMLVDKQTFDSLLLGIAAMLILAQARIIEEVR